MLLLVSSAVVGAAVGAAPLSASASPSSISGEHDELLSVARSNATTVTATGGAGAKTYSWAPLSGAAVTIDSPSGAVTTVSLTTLATSEARSGTIRCTVTDSTGSVTVDVAWGLSRP